MYDCIICRKHLIEPPPGGVIYEDDLLYAAHSPLVADEREHYLGHLLLETRRHTPGLATLTDDEAKALGLWSAWLAAALVASEGAEHVYSFVMGHHLPHMHIHLWPRYPGTPREYWGGRLDAWPGAPRGGPQQMAALTERLRRELANAVRL
jgi:diadenosine tetraphosphate (Ap4A) HIT family hydrolase